MPVQESGESAHFPDLGIATPVITGADDEGGFGVKHEAVP
jgi:hypothetical protein